MPAGIGHVPADFMHYGAVWRELSAALAALTGRVSSREVQAAVRILLEAGDVVCPLLCLRQRPAFEVGKKRCATCLVSLLPAWRGYVRPLKIVVEEAALC